VNNIDPSGLFTQAFGYLAEIQDIYAKDHFGDRVLYGQWTRLGGVTGDAFQLKPDVFNVTKRKWVEIKPLSLSGISRAQASYAKYLLTFSPFGYLPEIGWKPSTHVTIAGSTEIVFFNAGGIVFYTDATDNIEDLLVLTSVAAVRAFVKSPIGRRIIARTAVGVLGRIPILVTTRTTIDTQRLETHISIGSLFASVGLL